MLIETAKLTIDPTQTVEFETAVADCAPRFKTEPGCKGFALERGVAQPFIYYMRLLWDDMASHDAASRSASAAIWRDTVVPFFAQPTLAVYTEETVRFF